MEVNKIYEGHSLEVLKTFEDKSVDCVITSPPYFQLRKYAGIPDYVWDAKEECEHTWNTHIRKPTGGKGENANVGANRNSEANLRDGDYISNFCSKCGSWKGQLGLEPQFYCGVDTTKYKLKENLLAEDKEFVIMELIKLGLL